MSEVSQTLETFKGKLPDGSIVGAKVGRDGKIDYSKSAIALPEDPEQARKVLEETRKELNMIKDLVFSGGSQWL